MNYAVLTTIRNPLRDGPFRRFTAERWGISGLLAGVFRKGSARPLPYLLQSSLFVHPIGEELFLRSESLVPRVIENGVTVRYVKYTS